MIIGWDRSEGDEEVYVAPFKGWRVWELRAAAPFFLGNPPNFLDLTSVAVERPKARLRSLYGNNHLWNPNEPMVGVCLCKNPQPGIYESHSCGIYAFNSLENLAPELLMALAFYGRGRGINENDFCLVFGEVNLWGNVWIHELGYRAQYAYPERLFFINGHGRTGWNCLSLDDYGVPVKDGDLYGIYRMVRDNPILFGSRMEFQQVVDFSFRAVGLKFFEHRDFPWGYREYH